MSPTQEREAHREAARRRSRNRGRNRSRSRPTHQAPLPLPSFLPSMILLYASLVISSASSSFAPPSALIHHYWTFAINLLIVYPPHTPHPDILSCPQRPSSSSLSSLCNIIISSVHQSHPRRHPSPLNRVANIPRIKSE